METPDVVVAQFQHLAGKQILVCSVMSSSSNQLLLMLLSRTFRQRRDCRLQCDPKMLETCTSNLENWSKLVASTKKRLDISGRRRRGRGDLAVRSAKGSTYQDESGLQPESCAMRTEIGSLHRGFWSCCSCGAVGLFECKSYIQTRACCHALGIIR